MSGLAISTTGLVHIYRAHGHDVAALSGIGITVRPGELVGLLGPSGAGKSTLLQLCGGLLTPSAGRLQVGEHNVATMTDAELDRMRSGDVGIVLQGAGRNLIPYLTPADNIRYAQQAAPDDRDLPTPQTILELVGLGNHAATPLSQLTPGQVQLCAVAVGIATLPGLLLADEPTSQLDHHARDEVLAALRTINTETGMTVLLVTHDPEVAATLPARSPSATAGSRPRAGRARSTPWSRWTDRCRCHRMWPSCCRPGPSSR